MKPADPGLWPHASLGGLAAGLALAPLSAARSAAPGELAVLACAAIALAILHPGRPLAKGSLAPSPPTRTAVVLPWLALIGLLAVTAGLVLGALRLAAIDAGALQGPPGGRATLAGHLISTPTLGPDGAEAELDTPAGRVLLRGEGLEDHRIGDALRARGVLEPVAPWRADSLDRRGIGLALAAQRIEPAGESRGGVAGRIDVVRDRAEQALERGMPDREAALARGFVLGQDELIDGRTREDFRRSGLSHLLAVSGQNVVLLCLLAWPLLALAGIPLRARLLALLCLIAIYVPVTGAGPSIQRAGIMGAAALGAALLERPRSRWYALLLAAGLTLALNPRAGGDIGWQLSFAAVVGIFLWTRRLAALLDGGASRGSPRRALAEGAAMTAAATVSTAPLLAHHFSALSLSSLAANLLALPAVAPAMWLGMLAGIAGQIPAIPVEPLNWVNSLCLAYIAQVAHGLGSPDWALLDFRLNSWQGVAAAYVLLLGVAELWLAAAARRGGLGPRRAPLRSEKDALPSEARFARRWRVTAGLVIALVAAAVALGGLRAGSGDEAADAEMVVRMLDVGQGDAILLEPPGAKPILVDAGPPGADVAERLAETGVESLAAVVITHDQSDHAGGLPALLRAVAVERIVLARASASVRSLASAVGADLIPIAEGGELRSGDLRLGVLWPPPERLDSPTDDPNADSLVLLAEWRHLSLLLCGDAEAEAVPIDPGPVDVLKVAHHGSEDAGLTGLLERSAPKLAVISVGDNPYGHPAPETLAAIREHGVGLARTDEDGEVVIEADPAGWWAAG